jgi:hypothetical protein
MKEIIRSFCKTLFLSQASNEYGSEMWIYGISVVKNDGRRYGHGNG